MEKKSFLNRKVKKNGMNRELKNLEDYWNNPPKTKTLSPHKPDVPIQIKKRGRPKLVIGNSKKIIGVKSNALATKDTIFKSPIPLNNKTFYSLTELLLFLKIYFNLDYENFILKDEEKQEFKAKANDFFKEFTKIFKKSQILIQYEYIESFFELISQFTNLHLDKILDKFDDIAFTSKEEVLEPFLEYVDPTAFVCENPIRNDDAYKKKGGQYIKYKTIPKWHHYAWDMIKKSFIFTKFIEEDESNEYSKKKLDLDTIILKLKLKIYNNIYEFIDDLMKMIRYSTDCMHRINNAKNISFCKSIEVRLQKQVKKLKEDGKI